MKILLDFDSKVRQFRDGGTYRAIRLECGCRFFLKSGALTETKNIIIDTGALLTTLPYSIWSKIAYVKVGEDLLGGINPNENSKIPVDIAQVGVILTDKEGDKTDPIVLKSFLIPKEYPNSTPVIGFSDLLEKFKILLDYQNNFAYMTD